MAAAGKIVALYLPSVDAVASFPPFLLGPMPVRLARRASASPHSLEVVLNAALHGLRELR